MKSKSYVIARLCAMAALSSAIAAPVFAYEAPVVSGNAVAPSSEQPLIPVDSDNSGMAEQEQVTAASASAPPTDNGNLPNQVQMLQQQVQNLQGQLELQSHQITQMQSQQMAQYQDLDRRINLLAQGKRSEATQSLVTAGSAATVAKPTASSSAAYANNAGPAAIDANPEAPPPRAPAATTKPVAAAPAVAAASATVDSEQAAYEQAYNQLGKQQYSAAKNGFQGYLKQYPTGTYAADSHYWLGELALVTGDDASATKEFTTVSQQFASSPRVPASLMRLGSIYTASDKTAQAKEAYNVVIRRFPNSTEATQAKQLLSQLAQS